MANFCEGCGAPLKETDKFCQNCGRTVEQKAPEPAQQPPQPVQAAVPQTSSAPAGNAAMGAAGAMGAGMANQTAAKSYGYDTVDYTKREYSKTPDFLYDALEGNKLGQWINHKVYITEGRIGRMDYFIRTILWGLLGLVIYGIPVAIFNIACSPDTAATLDAIWYLVFFVFSLPGSVMLGIRRLHDLDKSGWWYLLLFVPLVNFFFALYMLFCKGTYGNNQYGPDPLMH